MPVLCLGDGCSPLVSAPDVDAGVWLEGSKSIHEAM